MAIKHKPFRIVCIRHILIFTEEDYTYICKLIKSARPNYWQYLDPDIIYAYFIETKKKAASAVKLMDELRALLISDRRFYGVGVGMLTTEMSADINFWGKIKSSPVGGAAEEVSRLAYEDAVRMANG
jgi:hypothetical protein